MEAPFLLLSGGGDVGSFAHNRSGLRGQTNRSGYEGWQRGLFFEFRGARRLNPRFSRLLHDVIAGRRPLVAIAATVPTLLPVLRETRTTVLAVLIAVSVLPRLALLNGLHGLNWLSILAKGGPIDKRLRLIPGRWIKARLGLLSRLLIWKGRRRKTVHGRREAVRDYVVVLVPFVGVHFARGPQITHLGLLLRELSRGDNAKIMLGVLEIALSHDRVSRRLRISCELQILLGDMMSGSTNFYIGSIRLICAGQRVRTLAIVATAHALILTWSHRGSLSETFPALRCRP